MSWLSIIVGIAAKSAEGASALSAMAIILPYLSSGFVLVESLPKLLRGFAKYQPMTPIIDTMRNAFSGEGVDTRMFLIALLWCIGLTSVFYVVSQILFKKKMFE